MKVGGYSDLCSVVCERVLRLVTNWRLLGAALSLLGDWVSFQSDAIRVGLRVLDGFIVLKDLCVCVCVCVCVCCVCVYVCVCVHV